MIVPFLFLESIGTPELFFIAFVALLIFGPRKLPTIGRTIGKYTSEFKKASNEFRQTWENEVRMVEMEENKQKPFADINQPSVQPEDWKAVENTIGRTSPRVNSSSISNAPTIAPPEIRHVTQADFAALTNNNQPVTVTETVAPPTKREWL